MSLKFNVFVSEIRAALLFASNDDSRIILNAVCFQVREKRSPLIVSTDGRRLVVIESEAEQSDECNAREGEIIVSAGFLKPLCQFAKSQATTICAEYFLPKRILFSMPESHCFVVSEAGAVVDGKFPNWKAIIPASTDKQPVEQIGLNSEYVSDFAKAAKALGAESPTIRMHMFSEESAVEVHIAMKPNFYGVIMPTKPEPVDRWQPSFLGM